MAFNDNAVFTAATGYVYTAPVGTAAPTPEELKNFNPDTFGAARYTIGSVTGEFQLQVGSASTAMIPQSADAGTIQSELEKLDSVGTGNVVVAKEDDGFAVSFIGELFGSDVKLEDANAPVDPETDGAPTVEVTRAAEARGWEPIGHTGEEDLPEFGYDGGDTETKGSWQKKSLKEITTESPVDYVTVKALQFDPKTLELYYGKNASKEANVFGVDNPAQGGVERAVLIVMVDGLFKISFSAAKASVRRDESISLSGEEFSTLPLRATFTKHPGRHLYEWTIPAAA